MKVAVLVKQVPRFEAMELLPNGRLRREGLELELNPYCRRAVSKGVELAREHGGTCTAITLGPLAADDVLREAVAWGADAGVLISDPAFAGSDTLATARALAAALLRFGPWDLVLVGRNSVDADTGQVGPEVAELLDLPFLAGVKELAISDGAAEVLCEHDDGFVRAVSTLPALVSCAERLCEPAKIPPEERRAVDPARIQVVSAADLGAGPWGQDGSPTAVGRVELLEVARRRVVLAGPPGEQAAAVVAALVDSGAWTSRPQPKEAAPELGESPGAVGPAVAVLVEPERPRVTAELLGAATEVAGKLAGHVVAVAFDGTDTARLAAQGADRLVVVTGAAVEEDAAAGVAAWAEEAEPAVIIAPGTIWGREVASRVAARLGAGLTGDAVDLTVEDGRLVGWKPAFGGCLVAAITASSPVQMVTLRPGMVTPPVERRSFALDADVRAVDARGRVRHLEAWRDDDVGVLTAADVVVGVGAGVHPDDYPLLDRLLETLGAELGGTRKVTDKGWLPRARQIGITGHSIGPRLYVAIGISGKFNHVIGVRGAGYVVAINADPDAAIREGADITLVGDWHELVPALVDELERARGLAASA
jgi:electron transfer flavoprotein alpha subunit